MIRSQTSAEGSLYELVARGVKDKYFIQDDKNAIHPFDWRFEKYPATIPEERWIVPINPARFGGRCEFRDRSEPLATATREFYEETLGAVLSVQECTEKLTVNPVQIVSKTLNGSPYYMYLMYIDYNNYTETFHKVANFLKYQFDSQETSKIIEKNTIRWVSMDTMLMCIEPNQRNTPLRLRGVFYKTMVGARDQIQFLIK
jgi:hypothetical protein